jgi:phosphonate transport system substrate-binding protein
MIQRVLALTAATLLLAVATAQTLTFVWYPNESTPEFAEARTAIVDVIRQATGREVREQLTTDYTIAIEAIVNNNAAFSWFGGEGYILANARNAAVQPLVVNTTASGSLNDAKYYSMIGVLASRVEEFKVNGEFSLDTLRQKRFTFVSNASTSGFRVPAAVLANHFGVSTDDLLLGGRSEIFADVLFGGSHQGAFFNVLTDRADAGVFCDSCINPYVTFSGTEGDPQPGDLATVKAGAEAPFDQVPGAEVVFVATYPVLNAPLVVNTSLISAEELTRIREAFTSEAVRNNPAIFGPSGSKSFFREGNMFVLVEDSWYDPIRRLTNP